MRKMMPLVVLVPAFVAALQPAVAVASYDCQVIRQYCCTKDGCDPCDWCLYCTITNPDGSDGGFVTDC